MDPIVIIGNGISGITTARSLCAIRSTPVHIISGESPSFYARTALMYVFMGQLTLEQTIPYTERSWSDMGIQRTYGHVGHIDAHNREVVMDDGRRMRYSQLVIATGSVPRRLGVRNEDLPEVQGFYDLRDLERMHRVLGDPWRPVRRAVVIGGGLIGVELAEMLVSRGVRVTMLVREERYSASVLAREEAALVHDAITRHGVEVVYGAEVCEFLEEGAALVAARTTDGRTWPCEWAGVSIGVEPAVRWLADSGVETATGVLVDEYLQSSVPGIYAVGDCAELRKPGPGRRAIEPLWYTGRKMGETLARTLAGKPTKYEPGPWFNSAKFFDLEYQVYGRIPAEFGPDDGTIWWQDVQGRRGIRFVYQRASGVWEGVQGMGVRLRQEVAERWLHEGRDMEFVRTHLRELFFDPEFTRGLPRDLLFTTSAAHGNV